MLLQKVDTFDKAIMVLLSEEQANADSKQCSESKDAAIFATSAYKRNQTTERQGFQNKSIRKPHPEYVCPRCTRVGQHHQSDCPSHEQNRNNCERPGHYAITCRKKVNSNATSTQANYIQAYLDTNSINEQIVFNSHQIEKAEACGLV